MVRLHQPLGDGCVFTAIIIFLDVFGAALPIERNFAMFSSVTGTWLPFLPIFLATCLTGRWMVGEN